MIGADDPVGRVIIPLGGLADQLIQDEMFYLQPMAGIGEGHEAAIDVWDVIGKDMGLGAIQLKLQLDLSSIGEFWSHFSPEVAPRPELPEFNMNALYGNLFLALDCIYPILGVVTAIVGIITWENVAVTWIWLGILIGLTYAPGYIPSAFHLLLLHTLFLNRVDQIRQESEALSSRQQERNAKAGQGSSGQQGEEEAKAATLGWIGTVTNILPIPTSTITTLRGLQAKLGSTAAKISGFYDLWLWTNQGATMGLAGGIGVSMLLHLPAVCSFWNIVFVELLFVFFATTRHFQQLLGAILGLVSYLTASLSWSAADLAATDGVSKLVERSGVGGTLGGSIRGLKKVRKEYADLDLEAISSSDQHDNGVSTYGPDGAGYEWNIHHSRKLNWKMRHSCQVEVTKRQVGGEAGGNAKKRE